MNNQDNRLVFLCYRYPKTVERPLCQFCPKLTPNRDGRFARWLYLDLGPVCKSCRRKLEKTIRDTMHSMGIRQPRFEAIKELPESFQLSPIQPLTCPNTENELKARNPLSVQPPSPVNNQGV